MSYHKPELLVLSLAAPAVRSVNDSADGAHTDSKGTTTGETRDAGHTTSSSTSAYEADE